MPHRPGNSGGSRASAGLLALAILMLTAACDSADSRTTARVERLNGETACLIPEDEDQTDLEGCFPIAAADAAQVQVGDCLSLVVPNQLDSDRVDDPIESIRVLDRKCRR